jgi:hypothetical protein
LEYLGAALLHPAGDFAQAQVKIQPQGSTREPLPGHQLGFSSVRVVRRLFVSTELPLLFEVVAFAAFAHSAYTARSAWTTREKAG